MSGPVEVMGRLATMALHHGEEWEEVHDAVAELIEADKELQFIRNNGCAAETYESAVIRHNAALARVQGGES